MPTYSYACEACGHNFEKEQRITEDAIKKCPKCKKNKARRMITSGNFILKGGGWYSDGYGSTSASKGNGSSDKGSSDKGSSDKGSSTSSSTSSASASDGAD